MENRIRRIRVRPGAAPAKKEIAIPSTDKAKMERLLKSISAHKEMLESLPREIAALSLELQKLMDVYQRKSFSVDDLMASIITPVGNATSVINAREFMEMVEEDDFFNCIRVVKEAATKVLSETELKSITDVTPGKKKDPILKVEKR